jgi:hypothetical protein
MVGVWVGRGSKGYQGGGLEGQKHSAEVSAVNCGVSGCIAISCSNILSKLLYNSHALNDFSANSEKCCFSYLVLTAGGENSGTDRNQRWEPMAFQIRRKQAMDDSSEVYFCVPVKSCGFHSIVSTHCEATVESLQVFQHPTTILLEAGRRWLWCILHVCLSNRLNSPVRGPQHVPLEHEHLYYDECLPS